jgi:hypothetical protein
LADGVMNIENNTIKFNVGKTIQKPNKYHGLGVRYKIFLPKGYSIDFDDKFWRYVEVRNDLQFDDEDERVKVWY